MYLEQNFRIYAKRENKQHQLKLNSIMNTKIKLALIFALMHCSVHAQKLSEIICSQEAVLWVDPTTLKEKNITPDQTYRFRIINKELFIFSEDQLEYKYNKIKEIEKYRFVSGHKTLLFNQDYTSLISSHLYYDEIRISKFKCIKV